MDTASNAQAKTFNLVRVANKERPCDKLAGVIPRKGVVQISGEDRIATETLAAELVSAIAEGGFCNIYKRAPVVMVHTGPHGAETLDWSRFAAGRITRNLCAVTRNIDIASAEDIRALADVVPPGATVLIDTVDYCWQSLGEEGEAENVALARDEIAKGSEALQALTGGLVLVLADEYSRNRAMQITINVVREDSASSACDWTLHLMGSPCGAGHAFEAPVRRCSFGAPEEALPF